MKSKTMANLFVVFLLICVASGSAFSQTKTTPRLPRKGQRWHKKEVAVLCAHNHINCSAGRRLVTFHSNRIYGRPS